MVFAVCEVFPYIKKYVKYFRVTYTHNSAWMDLESTMLSEIGQVVKDKYHMISPINGT